MSDKAFLDTNFIIYLYSQDEEPKKSIALNVLNTHDCVASIHVMNESSNVWLKKFNLGSAKTKECLDNVELVCDEILPIQRSTIDKTIDIKERYGFSYYDSLMLASALESDCKIIFTEDMNNGQIIDDTLKIVNPFV